MGQVSFLQEWYILGVGKGVLFREVSSVQRLKEWYLGWEKVSCLERCPQFRGWQEWYLGWEKVSCLERCPQFRG